MELLQRQFLPPGDLGGGSTEKVVNFFVLVFRGVVYISYLFFLEVRRGTHGSAHTPGKEAGPGEAGAAPGFGCGAGGSRWLRISEFPPQLWRPGNVRPVSGAGAGPSGRKEHPSTHPLRQACGFSPPENGALPHSSFGVCLWGRLWEREAWKIRATFLGLWGGVRAITTLTLKKGRDIPHLSLSPVKRKLRKIHSLKRLSPSSQGYVLGIKQRRPSSILLPQGRTHHCRIPGPPVWSRDLRLGMCFKGDAN